MKSMIGLIDALGGNKKIARALGITPAAVTHWSVRNKWPALRVIQIAAIGAENGLHFDVVSFLEKQSIINKVPPEIVY